MFCKKLQQFTYRCSFTLVISLMLFLAGIATSVRAEVTASTSGKLQQSKNFVKAVRAGRKMSVTELNAMETALEQDQGNLEIWASIIGYYFYQGLRIQGKRATLKARRKHINWLIKHVPSSKLAGMPEATIDPSGHSLADQSGYETASSLWRSLITAKDSDNKVLLNAANFFRLNDKPQSEKALTKAGASYNLGELYALGALRINGMNQNGLVSSIGSSPLDNEYSRYAVQKLKETTDLTVIDSAATFLLTRGVMLQMMVARSNPLEPSPVKLAGEILQKCPKWCGSWQLYYQMKGMMTTSPEEK